MKLIIFAASALLISGPFGASAEAATLRISGTAPAGMNHVEIVAKCDIGWGSQPCAESRQTGTATINSDGSYTAQVDYEPTTELGRALRSWIPKAHWFSEANLMFAEIDKTGKVLSYSVTTLAPEGVSSRSQATSSGHHLLYCTRTVTDPALLALKRDCVDETRAGQILGHRSDAPIIFASAGQTIELNFATDSEAPNLISCYRGSTEEALKAIERDPRFEPRKRDHTRTISVSEAAPRESNLQSKGRPDFQRNYDKFGPLYSYAQDIKEAGGEVISISFKGERSNYWFQFARCTALDSAAARDKSSTLVLEGVGSNSPYRMWSHEK